MTNRMIAVLGIGTYVLSVYSSATTSEGQSSVPEFVVIISGIASLLFAVIATIRLWRIKKAASILLGVTSLLLFASEFLKVTLSPNSGSSLIIFINLIMIIAFLSFFYAVIVLWKTADNFNSKVKYKS